MTKYRYCCEGLSLQVERTNNGTRGAGATISILHEGYLFDTNAQPSNMILFEIGFSIQHDLSMTPTTPKQSEFSEMGSR